MFFLPCWSCWGLLEEAKAAQDALKAGQSPGCSEYFLRPLPRKRPNLRFCRCGGQKATRSISWPKRPYEPRSAPKVGGNSARRHALVRPHPPPAPSLNFGFLPISPPPRPSTTRIVAPGRFFPSRALRGQEARREAVQAAFNDYGVLFFFTHGSANFSQPLQSGLLMVGDEWLTLGDILAACETGVPSDCGT